MATLRSMAAAQEQFRESCNIDTNQDGEGEYAFLSELAGVVPLRVAGADGLPAVGEHLLDPPYLASAFGSLLADGVGHGVVERQGYLFKVLLAGPGGRLVAESPEGGPRSGDMGATWVCEGAPDRWCAYAWPARHGAGRRAFHVDQEGQVLFIQNRSGAFRGREHPPLALKAWPRLTEGAREDLHVEQLDVWRPIGN